MVDDLPYDLIGLHSRRPCVSAFVCDFSDFAPTRLVERMADIPGGALRQKQRERERHSNPNPNQHDTRPIPNLGIPHGLPHLKYMHSGVFVGLAYQGKDIVFRFILKCRSLRDLGP